MLLFKPVKERHEVMKNVKVIKRNIIHKKIKYNILQKRLKVYFFLLQYKFCKILFKICYSKFYLFLGSINNCLTADGLSDFFAPVEDIRQFANFFMFMSTMQGFLSIRDKEKGKYIFFIYLD